MKTYYNKQQRFGFGGFWIDKDKLFDAMFTGACIFTIVASAIFGTWALLVTMSLQGWDQATATQQMGLA